MTIHHPPHHPEKTTTHPPKLIINSSLILTLSLLLLLLLHSSSNLIHAFESPPTIPTEQLTCKPTGLIQDTSCNFETIDDINRQLHAQLSQAVRLPIFRYHKVDLHRQCPFWSEDGLCANRACAVDELDQTQIPQFWKSTDLGDLQTTSPREIPIDLNNKCVVKEQDYCVLDGDDGMPANGVYVDLLANPERFTGYSGPSAHRVWRAIYQENCFDAPQRPPSSPFITPPPSHQAGLDPQPISRSDGPSANETCLEKRVYYKLLSGIHTSISMHICDEYLDPSTGQWVPNLQCYLNRIGLYPERLENLYFAYTLMLRALSRSASYLASSRMELCTGDAAADDVTRQTLDRLIAIAHSYPVSFDETSMFKSGRHGQNTLKDEFKEHFRNVSRIMDCVGCDKCRLWGKLQITGLGTGLKLLFEYEEGSLNHTSFHLTRPELIAFINTLNRLCESVAAVDKFTKLWQQRSVEGTLPDRIRDEKLDGFASGRAAKAISLSSGLGPRSSSIPIERISTEKVKAQVSPSASQQSITHPGSQASEESLAQSPLPSTTCQTPFSPSNRLKPEPKKIAYSSSIHHGSPSNRSDPSTRWTMRSQVVDLALLVKQPASRLFKLFGEKCKHSYGVCSHWFASLFGQVKTFMFLSRAHPHHGHHQPPEFHPNRAEPHTEKTEL